MNDLNHNGETPAGSEQQALIQAIIASSTHTHYTDRPDLVLKALEEICPGTVKEMVEHTKNIATRNEEARFSFGKHQAYTALVLQATGAVASLILAFYCVSLGHVFSGILASALLYAVTQGGLDGFNRLIEAIANWIGKKKD